MRYHFAATAIALTLSMLASACQPAAESGALTDEDLNALRSLSDTYVERTLAGDFGALAEMFTDDVTIIPPNEAIVEGRAAAQAYFEAYPTITEFEATTVEVGGHGDVAFVRGTYSLTANADGEEINDSGRWMIIVERQETGEWLTSVEMWNSDQPLPETT